MAFENDDRPDSSSIYYQFVGTRYNGLCLSNVCVHVFQSLLKFFKRRFRRLLNPLFHNLSIWHLLFLHHHQRQHCKYGEHKIKDPHKAKSVVVRLDGWDFVLRFKGLDGRS